MWFSSNCPVLLDDKMHVYYPAVKKTTNKTTSKKTPNKQGYLSVLRFLSSGLTAKLFLCRVQISRLVVKKKEIQGCDPFFRFLWSKSVKRDVTECVQSSCASLCVEQAAARSEKQLFSPCSCHCTFDSGLPHEPQREANDDS